MDIKKSGLTGGLVALAAAVIIFWGVRSLAFILAPLAMAMVITIAILPLPGWFIKKGVKPGLALILTFVAVVGALALIAFVVIASVGKLVGLLPTYGVALPTQTSLAELTSAVSGISLSALLEPAVPVTTTATIRASAAVTPTSSSPALQPFTNLDLSSLANTTRVSDAASSILVWTGKVIAQGFTVLFIFVFMLSVAFSLRKGTLAGFTADDPRMADVQQFTVEVRQYVNIMAVINFLVAIGNTLILVILGIPFAVLWGILSFFMGFIPSIGWWISLIPPFLIGLGSVRHGTALIVLVSYILINGGVQNIVQPRMMGKSLRISPLVVFVSVIVWADVLGGMGALIAVPLTMIVMKVLESAESTRWIVALMRVGAGTDEEAKENAQAYEKLRGLTGKLRDALPFGSSGDKKKAASAADSTAES